ncbi:MAG: HAD family hydrolase, partial [Anaerovoracaceae bacterium]
MATLVFDYDGTLHECIKIYAPAFRKAYAHLVSCGLMPERIWKDDEISIWLGYSSKDMWNSFAPKLSQEQKMYCSQLIGDEMERLIESG